ncbi:hypothetical protein BDW27_110166 [Nocardiopsis sp. L17-MgMaSL7]|nr:hypothetical protein BDW27_110166 [Nocardiopsis sp. L17-MgMaSL7]
MRTYCQLFFLKLQPFVVGARQDARRCDHRPCSRPGVRPQPRAANVACGDGDRTVALILLRRIWKEVSEKRDSANADIALLKSYIEKTRKKKAHGVLISLSGFAGVSVYVVDLMFIDWDPIAPGVKFLILLVFCVLSVFGILTRVFPGVVIPSEMFESSPAVSLNSTFASEGKLEAILIRLRELKKKSLESGDDDPAKRRVAYKEEAAGYVEDLRKESTRYRNVSNFVQVVIIVGSLVGSAAAASSYFVREYSWFVAVNSLAIGIASGFSGYWKYKERSFYAQQAADAIEHEIESLDLGIGRYTSNDPAERSLIFSQEIMRLRQDQKMREQNLDQPSSGSDEGSQ